MRKIIYFKTILLILLLSVFVSCKKNNVKTVEVDNSFALSLFSDTIVLDELLKMMDTTVTQWISIDENGYMSAFYADSLNSIVTGSQILGELDDITFDMSEVFEMPTIPALPEPIPFELDLDSLITLPFEFEQFQINSVVMESGMLNFNMSTDIPNINRVELRAENLITADGTALQLNLEIMNNSANITADFTDCQIIPINGNIVFSVKIFLTVGEQEIGGNYYFNLDGSITDMKLKSLNGGINDILIRFDEKTDIEFGINNIYGDLSVNTPDVKIEYLNTFGFEVQSSIDSLYFKDVQNNYSSLLKNWEPLALSFNYTNGAYATIGNITESIVDEIDVLHDYDELALNGFVMMGCDNLTAEMISQDSRIDLIAEVRLPLSFNINNLRFIDTIEFNISDSNDDVEQSTDISMLDELEFKIAIDNGLPIKIMPQLYMLENNVVTDSIFDERAVINACFDGHPNTDIITISVHDELLNNVLMADNIIIDIALSTEANNVILNANDYFSLRLGVKTHTTGFSF